jgi:hypothetical protein
MMTKDLIAVENDLDNPVFVWNNVTYPCVPGSDTQLLKVDRGLAIVKTLGLTVRNFNADGSFLFPNNTIPQSQDDITYQGEDFRIEEVSGNVLRCSFNMLCVSNTRNA